MCSNPAFKYPERPGLAEQLAMRLDGKVDERNPDVVWFRGGAHVARCTFLGQVFLNKVHQVGRVGDGVNRIANEIAILMDELDAADEQVA